MSMAVNGIDESLLEHTSTVIDDVITEIEKKRPRLDMDSEDEDSLSNEIPELLDDCDVSKDQDADNEKGSCPSPNMKVCSNGFVCSGEPLSKRQMKKLQKYTRMIERRKMKRLMRRQKRKEVLKVKRAEGKEILTKKFLKSKTMEASSCRIRVAVDCQFLNVMTSKEISHLSRQLMYCYAVNRRRHDPMQAYFVGVKDPLKDRLKKMGYDGWDVNKSEGNLTDVFNKSEIVYLTSESENVLQQLDESKAYIIGGLVDHNRFKSLCYNFAVENGIAHAKLPLEDFIKMKTRHVLTINHTFEILSHFIDENDWESAIIGVMPKRKNAVPLSHRKSNERSSSSSDDT